MSFFKNHKFLTAMFMTIGAVAFAANLIIFQKIAFDEQESIKKALTGEKADDQNNLLPDIKKNEPISKSKVRDEEVAKVKPSLPYTDPAGRFSITFYDSTKVLQAEIQASNIEQYRERKREAEVILSELGADNVCYLAVLWAVPVALNRETTADDITTSGCPG